MGPDEEVDEYQERLDDLCDMFGLEETELEDLMDECDLSLEDFWI